MQKKILVLALAGLSSAAFAQSNVTISGAIEAHLEQISAKGAAAGSAADLTTRTRITDNTSWLRFSGSENLGNGMAAFFQVETDLGIDSGNTGASPAPASATGAFNRNSAVGIKGNWGSVLMGHWDAQYTAQLEGGVDFGSAGALPHSANSMNLTAQIGNGGVSATTGALTGASALIGGRLNNVIAYSTPDFNGLSARLAWTAGTEAQTAGLPNKNTGWNLFAKYANGPMNAFYAHLRVNNASEGAAAAAAGINPAVDDVTSNRLGFAYSFPMGLKVGVVWDKTKVEGNGTVAGGSGTNLQRTAWSLPISYTMGAHGLYFAYAKAGNLSGTLAPVGVNSGAKNVILGYTYSLSKRTQLGMSYSKISNDAGVAYGFWTRNTSAAVPPGADPTSLSFGINHAF